MLVMPNDKSGQLHKHRVFARCQLRVIFKLLQKTLVKIKINSSQKRKINLLAM